MKSYPRVSILSFLVLLLLSFSMKGLRAQTAGRSGGGRGVSFSSQEKPWVWWFWLGSAVTKESIDVQLRQFQRSGFGGVVIISTYGVKGYEDRDIPFRSPKWFNMLHYTIREAGALRLGVDMGLSSAWPFGGPSVTPSQAAKMLKSCTSFRSTGGALSRQLLPEGSKDFVLAVVAQKAGAQFVDLTRKVSPAGRLKSELPAGDWTIYVLTGANTNQLVKRSGPGGEGLVLDQFSGRALAAYLHGYDSVPGELSGIRSVMNDSYEVYKADATDSILREFEARRGYSLVPFFPLLFDSSKSDAAAGQLSDNRKGVRGSDTRFGCGSGDQADSGASAEASRVLCDYRETISDLLLDGFMHTWSKWSNGRGILTTEQAHGAPANILDLYGAADIPQTESFGPAHFPIPNVRVDKDIQRPRSKWPDILMFKFASSAANVNGRRLCSAETATWLTNHFRMALSQLKPQLDQLFVAGINHTMLISATNVPPDVPFPGWKFYPAPDFGRYAAFYNYLPDLSTYIARCQHLLQQSKPDNDVLLYFPVYDYYSEAPRDLGVLATFDAIPGKWGDRFPFPATARKLKNAGISFDYVSDLQLQQLSYDGSSLVTAAGGKYKAIVIPQCRRMAVKTMRHLAGLARHGAPVIFENGMPKDVPGWKDWSQRLAELKTIEVEMRNAPHVRVSSDLTDDCTGAGCTREYFPGLEFIRKNGVSGKLYFVANLDSVYSSGWITPGVPASGLECYDPMTGKRCTLQRKTGADGKYAFRLELLPGQSCFLFPSRGEKPRTAAAYFCGSEPTRLGGSWEIRFEKGAPYVPRPIATRVLKSWTELGDSATKSFSGTACYRLKFDLPAALNGSRTIRLTFTDLRDMADVELNGHPVGRVWSVPYVLDIDRGYFTGKDNELRIHVTNLATNRIIWMDRHKIPWKSFYIADPLKGRFDASDWDLQPSGIVGPVTLTGASTPTIGMK
ncbi:MAG TPA: glycosyl hydrolase [Puia sp.]|nr:glycosyl hydrolase [Puia sp.]